MPRKEKITGIVASFMLHLFLFLYLFLPPVLHKRNTASNLEENKVEVQLLSDPKVSRNTITIPKSELGLTMPSEISEDIIPCKDKASTYQGIGVLYYGPVNAVYKAPEQYPAYRAGIRVGDQLLNPGEEVINGYVDVYIQRGYEKLRFHIKIGTICFEEMPRRDVPIVDNDGK